MSNYLTISNLIAFVRIVLDIAVVAVVVYYTLKIVRNNSRTIQIFKGILFIVIADLLAKLIGLTTVEYITTQFINWGFLAIIIIFQPELRSLLERLGRTSALNSVASLTLSEKEKLVNELVKTSRELSKTKTGAIMSLEVNQSLSDYIKTGTQMNSEVTTELLCSIFVPGTPLHDGVVIIQGDKIACASAYFPPTVKEFPSIYGARHRAAVGISEINDCITIVVSEETGRISIARNGELNTVSADELRDYLMDNIVTLSAQDEQELQTLAATPKPKKIQHRIYVNRLNEDELIEAKEIVMKRSTPEKKGGRKNGR